MSTAQILRKLKSQGKTAFIPYITAGDPSLEATGLFAKALVDAGAAVLELGVPFSDPMADGPVNRRSAERALKNGASLSGILLLVRRLREGGMTIPIVLFTYFNPLFKMGLEEFAKRAKDSGLTGVLTLDLPPEEAAEYRKSLGAAGIETVFLAAPTSDERRLKLIDEASTGFVYYVSRTGVTGVRSSISDSLEEELLRVKRRIKNPVVVGFGISGPEQARAVARLADGVVVGSALVKLIEENQHPGTAAAKLRSFTETIVAAISNDPGRSGASR
jgi:tryptophan synthase alpha chain